MPLTTKVYTAILPNGSLAVMDTRKGRGRWLHLNASAGRVWHYLLAGATLKAATESAADHFIGLGADEDTVRADMAALSHRLLEADLARAQKALPPLQWCRPRPFPSAEVQPSRTDRFAAAAGLAAALLLLHCTPFRFGIWVGRLLARLPGSDATAREAEALFLAVRWARSIWLGRAACLEESLGCYLALRLRGRRAAWAIGARATPTATHAWVEAEGQVIGQDLGDEIWPYRPAVRV
ncbi:lasso peptide biosynthesis B2 protein [Streptomyces sp. RS10V-4]|uniref:lasso peptide biosynthesis B2 protein n=1 Tax=Streptomyces rhizoryzae TaxID=2932493 RepID=UPI0020053BCE|nr:lasso peptide biosynthesis B2 protein [Streptomyces rhizoryzae]MCK7627227.1 lasso peptide biosynthesis B2 protein [Streptomyces rhizoryzae]